MAWYKKYRIPFQSLEGTQYMAYIYEQTDGDVVTLTGAANPFVTQEENDNDIFKPIRTQSGYLKIIDETGSILETLVPSNNTQKLVRLYSGTWNSTMTTFYDYRIMWQGFLCAEAFTQSWDNQKKVIEFPVKSLLAALEDVTLPKSMLGIDTRIAKYVVEAFNAIGATPEEVVCISNLNDVIKDMLSVFISPSAFFSDKTINNQGDSYVEYVGMSFYEVLSEIAKLYGVTFRENEGKLYICMYDNSAGSIGKASYMWNAFLQIAAGQTTTGPMSGVGMPNLLDTVTFSGDDNVAGFLQGGKLASVTVNLGGMTPVITLPPTEETTDEPIAFAVNDGTLYVQTHEPRTLDEEDFYFNEYEGWSSMGGCDFEDVLDHTLIKGYTQNPYVSPSNYHLYAGAFPVRWFHRKGTERIVLANGLYINSQYRIQSQTGSATPAEAYRINTPIELSAYDGWIRIDFKLFSLISIDEGVGNWVYLFGRDATMAYFGTNVSSSVQIALQVGGKWWNGSAWVASGTPTTTNFTVTFLDETLYTNKTTDMNTEVEGGFFVPVNVDLYGEVEIYILNYIPVTAASIPRYCYSHILSDLDVKHVRPDSITASDRTANNYMKPIVEGGFSGEKNISTSVGTYNNNRTLPCFLRRDNSTYMEGADYYQTQTVQLNQRPEMNLVQRMVAHYGQVRRTYTAIKKYVYYSVPAYGLYDVLYQYLSKSFFAVEAKHDWRDDTQEVKFIEVT